MAKIGRRGGPQFNVGLVLDYRLGARIFFWPDTYDQWRAGRAKYERDQRLVALGLQNRGMHYGTGTDTLDVTVL
jgi:hypothetical protein